MKTPRLGSTAKAWTEVSSPERTTKVPRIASTKVTTPRNSVQTRSTPVFSTTISEWMNAVPVSHGMKERFSTGSQNQNPPQPSS